MHTQTVAGSSLCTLSGDPHIATFDRNMIHYQSVCKYIVTDSLDCAPADFTVYARNERTSPTSTVSAIRYIEIVFNSTIVRFWRESFTSGHAYDIPKVSLVSGNPPNDMTVIIFIFASYIMYLYLCCVCMLT